MADRPRFRTLGFTFGVLFLVAAFIWLGEEIRFGSIGQSAKAVVLNHQRTRRGNGYAMVEFEAPGQTVKARVRTIFYFDPTPGEIVPLLYRANEPTDARIDTFEQRYLIVLIILGVAILWNAGNVFAWTRRRTGQKPTIAVETMLK